MDNDNSSGSEKPALLTADTGGSPLLGSREAGRKRRPYSKHQRLLLVGASVCGLLAVVFIASGVLMGAGVIGGSDDGGSYGTVELQSSDSRDRADEIREEIRSKSGSDGEASLDSGD